MLVSSPLKAILIGEHSAVYGCPVLVGAIDLRCKVKVEAASSFFVKSSAIGVELSFEWGELRRLREDPKLKLVAEVLLRTSEELGETPSGLRIKILSPVPPASGLGSSAAVASALVKGISTILGHELSVEEVAKLAWRIEDVVHGKSSGVDPFATSYGGLLVYQWGKVVKRLGVEDFPPLTVAYTGKSSATEEVVKSVALLKERHLELFELYLGFVNKLVEEAVSAVERKDFKTLGELMNVNHGLLSAIGVSCLELEELVWAMRGSKECYGSKLSGAGRGGIAVGLGGVANSLRAKGFEAFETRITSRGVELEA